MKKIQKCSGTVGYGSCNTDENGDVTDSFTRGDYFIKELKEHLGNHFVNFEFEPYLADEKELLTLAAQVQTPSWTLSKNVNVVFTGAKIEGVQIREGEVIRRITPEIPTSGGFHQLGKMVLDYYSYQLEPNLEGIYSFEAPLLRGLGYHPIYQWYQRHTNKHLFFDWGNNKRFTHIGVLATEVALGNIKPIPHWDKIYSQGEAKSIIAYMLYSMESTPFDAVNELLSALSESTDSIDEEPLTRIMGIFPWSNFGLKTVRGLPPNTEVISQPEFEKMLNYAGYLLTYQYASLNQAVRINWPDQPTSSFLWKFVPFFGSQH